MTSKERKEKIQAGAVFMVGGVMYRVETVESGNARIRNIKNGQTFNHGVDALSRLNITFC